MLVSTAEMDKQNTKDFNWALDGDISGTKREQVWVLKYTAHSVRTTLSMKMEWWSESKKRNYSRLPLLFHPQTNFKGKPILWIKHDGCFY